MSSTGLSGIIEQFIRRIRFRWQIIFVVSVIVYGISFYHHLQFHPEMKIPTRMYRILDQVFFVVALGLAVGILFYKRKYFTLKYFRKRLEALHHRHSRADARELLRLILRELDSRFNTVWWMGFALILMGVFQYWLTFVSRNMNIYFIVGLYSVLLNYPRQDLLIDIPYLAQETVRESGAETNQEEAQS